MERINEAERAYCLVPTINDKLSHSSSSVGKGGRQEKVGGEAAKAEGVPTGCPWFSSKSLVHANTSVKVLQIINRCCTWGRRKKKKSSQLSSSYVTEKSSTMLNYQVVLNQLSDT